MTKYTSYGLFDKDSELRFVGSLRKVVFERERIGWGVIHKIQIIKGEELE